jgi:hypothetical protein
MMMKNYCGRPGLRSRGVPSPFTAYRCMLVTKTLDHLSVELFSNLKTDSGIAGLQRTAERQIDARGGARIKQRPKSFATVPQPSHPDSCGWCRGQKEFTSPFGSP